MGRRISPEEFEEWYQDFLDQPWGEYRDNMHSAIVAATIVNMLKGKAQTAVSWKQFMLRDREEYQAEELTAAIGSLMKMAVSKKELKRAKARKRKRKHLNDRPRKARRKARS